MKRLDLSVLKRQPFASRRRHPSDTWGDNGRSGLRPRASRSGAPVAALGAAGSSPANSPPDGQSARRGRHRHRLSIKATDTAKQGLARLCRQQGNRRPNSGTLWWTLGACCVRRGHLGRDAAAGSAHGQLRRNSWHDVGRFRSRDGGAPEPPNLRRSRCICPGNTMLGRRADVPEKGSRTSTIRCSARGGGPYTDDASTHVTHAAP